MMALLHNGCLVVIKSYGDSQGGRKDLVKTSLGPAAWKDMKKREECTRLNGSQGFCTVLNSSQFMCILQENGQGNFTGQSNEA